MSAHDQCPQSARQICERLLSLLTQSGITRYESENWCSFVMGNRARCAWARHSRNGLRVYLRAPESDESQLAALSKGNSASIARRHAMGSEWAKSTPYYFDLKSQTEVADAAPLILFAARQLKNHSPRRSYLLPSEDSASEMVEGSRITVPEDRPPACVPKLPRDAPQTESAADH